MYVVRIMVDGSAIDHKAFSSLASARERFVRGWIQTHNGEFDSMAIFEVPGTDDVRKAVQAVKDGDKDMVRLIDLQESQDIWIAKIAPTLEIDL